MQAKNKEVEALTDEVRAVLGHVVGRTSPRLHIGVPLTVCVAVCVCVCVCGCVCVCVCVCVCGCVCVVPATASGVVHESQGGGGGTASARRVERAHWRAVLCTESQSRLQATNNDSMPHAHTRGNEHTTASLLV